MHRRHALALVLLPTAQACRRRRSPEDRIRETLSALESAIEEKNPKACRAAISARFASAEVPDRASALALLRGHFLRRPRLYLFTRIVSLEIETPGQAKVSSIVAMAAVPLPSARNLVGAGADVYRFDLSLAEETGGAWRITHANWEPANADDLL